MFIIGLKHSSLIVEKNSKFAFFKKKNNNNVFFRNVCTQMAQATDCELIFIVSIYKYIYFHILKKVSEVSI